MVKIKAIIKIILVATILKTCIASPLFAEKNNLSNLYADLKNSNAEAALEVEKEIKRLWGLSGSPSIDFLYEKGKNAYLSGDYKTSIKHYSSVIEFAPDLAMGWFARSRSYSRIDYDGPALEDIKKALYLDPNHFYAVLALGQLLEKLDMPSLAFKAYQEALEIHPHFGEAKQLKELIDRSALDRQI